jgi:fibronectin-binding autotransporter adhesin
VISSDSARELSKGGAGTLVLSGANTYTGGTRVESGILSVASLANAGANSPIGNYPAAGAGGLTLAGGILRYTGGTTSTNRGLSFSGNGTLDVNAAGTALTLGNCESVDIPGTLTVSGGAGSSLALDQVRIVEGAGITLNPTSIPVTVSSVNGYTSYPNHSDITLGGTANGNIITGNLNVTNPPGSPYTQPIRVTKSGSSGWTMAGVFSSGGTMTVTGGTLTLSGTNTYTGATAVQGGTLIAGTNSLSNTNGAFGKATSEVNLGVANGNSNAAILNGGPYTIGRIIRLLTQNTADTGTRILTLGGNTAHHSVFSGNIILGTNSQAGRGVTLTAASGGTVTFSGVIQNPASMDATSYTVTKAGPGTVILSNSNTYTGGTLVSEGMLVLTGATQATTAITFSSNSSLGLVIGSPVTAASAAVNLSNGRIAVTGTPTNPSHTLLSALSINGTPVLASPVPGYQLQVIGNQLQLNQIITDPYTVWSGGAAFDADANGDGVDNGLAFLLGAANVDVNATSLLPAVTQSSGNLVLTFHVLNAASRGTASLNVQHSSDLAISDAWLGALVPDTAGISGPVNGVTFNVTLGSPANSVTATISSSGSVSGTLFGRVIATE